MSSLRETLEVVSFAIPAILVISAFLAGNRADGEGSIWGDLTASKKGRLAVAISILWMFIWTIYFFLSEDDLYYFDDWGRYFGFLVGVPAAGLTAFYLALWINRAPK